MIVFLDIDGVLRRASAPRYCFERDLLDRFEDCIRRLPEARIVIASTWRAAWSIPEIRERFSADVGACVIGGTPRAARPLDHQRHREVRAWLRKRSLESAPWVALDDDPLHDPPLPNVRILDADEGFDEAAARWLLARAGLGDGS